MGTNKVWQIIPNPNQYRSFEFVDKSSTIELKRKLHTGCSMLDSWNNPLLKFYNGEKKEVKKHIGDVHSFCGELILTNELKNRLSDIIKNTVEFLPINTEIGLCWLLNIAPVECLDKEKSEIQYFSTGKIMSVTKYSFFIDKLIGKNIFVIPELGGKVLLISDELKQFIEQNGIKGFSFIPIEMSD